MTKQKNLHENIENQKKSLNHTRNNVIKISVLTQVETKRGKSTEPLQIVRKKISNNEDEIDDYSKNIILKIEKEEDLNPNNILEQNSKFHSENHNSPHNFENDESTEKQGVVYKKKKHRTKYKNNNIKKNQAKKKVLLTLDETPDSTNLNLKKTYSDIHPSSIINLEINKNENKSEIFTKQFSNLNSNVVSKNLDVSILGETTKDRTPHNFNFNPQNIIFNEEYNRKNRQYSVTFNKYNSLPQNPIQSPNYSSTLRAFSASNRGEENPNTIYPFNLGPMNCFNIMQKFDKGINFYFKIHNELIDYTNNINDINLILKDIKVYTINYLENLIKQLMSNLKY